MKNFLSQKLEIQIPNQKNYSGMTTMPTSHKSLIEFLKNNFKFPSDNPTDIANFICSDYELEKIIYDLPKIITNELLKIIDDNSYRENMIEDLSKVKDILSKHEAAKKVANIILSEI